MAKSQAPAFGRVALATLLRCQVLLNPPRAVRLQDQMLTPGSLPNLLVRGLIHPLPAAGKASAVGPGTDTRTPAAAPLSLPGAHLAISLTSTWYSTCGGQIPKIYPLPSPSRRLTFPESLLGLRDQPFDSRAVGQRWEGGVGNLCPLTANHCGCQCNRGKKSP